MLFVYKIVLQRCKRLKRYNLENGRWEACWLDNNNLKQANEWDFVTTKMITEQLETELLFREQKEETKPSQFWVQRFQYNNVIAPH